MSADTLALVGAVGGAGTTRMTVETAAVLARAGRDVAVLDAAFGTQGLARYYRGRIEPDLTAVLVGDASLEDAMVALDVEGPGTVHLTPARAPLSQFAGAMTAGAAEAFERQIGGAGLAHDVVLVDTPPVAGNQAIAAVTTADRVAVVTPADPRGRDALALMAERLADLGAPHDLVVGTFADGGIEAVPEAVAGVPTAETTAPSACPTAGHPGSPIGPAVADVVEAAFGVRVERGAETDGSLGGLLSRD